MSGRQRLTWLGRSALVGLAVLGCGDDRHPGVPDAPPGQGIPGDDGPAFALEASAVDLVPDQLPEIRIAARDGQAHPGWTYAFSDGKSGAQRGAFAAVVAGEPAAQVYTPAPCALLGGGEQALTLQATATDPASGRSSTASIDMALRCPAATFYTTKTPYRPAQDPATYEPPPAGFAPVFTELVARHGSRGLSSPKYDLALYAMIQKASADGALTPLGQQLGDDVQRIMRRNALLGAGVPGISTPGYGNLTQLGIREQQELAGRLLARLPSYFAGLGASGDRRILEVVSSGVDRAVDSAGFFSAALVAAQPSLGSLIVKPAAPAGYPAGAPIAQPAGTNRFLLYFHKLAAATDLVADPADPLYATYQASQDFQRHAGDADMLGKVDAVLATPDAVAAARAVLERLFAPAFVDKIADGTYQFANTGTFTFVSDDATTVATITGDGKTKVKSLTDAASMLYNLYVIAPAMAAELGGDFTEYMPASAAQMFAYLQDAQDFYEIGPSIAERAPVTYAMASGLEDDFFHQVDAIAAGDLSRAAVLRFTHAEIIVPFAARLGVAATSVPLAETYNYAAHAWRGELVAPLTANVQWDVYRNAAGRVVVNMLYNEKQTAFKPACDGARVGYRSAYYDYAKLKACYGRP